MRSLFIDPPEIHCMKCSLYLSIDYAMDDKWSKTIPGEIPRLFSVTQVEKGQKFSIYLHMLDLSPEQMNTGHVIADVGITGPDGVKFMEEKDRKIIITPSLSPGAGVLCPIMLGGFEQKDQLGKYKVTVRVRELAGNTSMTVEQEFMLVEFTFVPFPNREDAFNIWYTNYHEQPAPDKAISAFFFWLSTEKYHEDIGDFPPVFAFFLEIFRNNAYLVPHLMELFAFQDDRIRFFILYALVQLKVDAATFFNSLRDADATMLEEVSGIAWDFEPYQDLTSLLCDEDNLDDEQFTRPNNQLDILWGTFFASGSYKPILRIVDTLKLKEYSEYPGEFQGKKDLTIDKINKVQLGLAFQAAKMSLEKYCSEYPQVRIYCTHHHAYENPPEPIKTELKAILKQSTFN